MRIRGEARVRRHGRSVRGTFLVGLMAVVAPLAATDGDVPCASPGWLAAQPTAAAAAEPMALAERLTLRFDRTCSRPFVIELELRLLFADRRAPVVRRSAPREFRPGERFLPGEAYLVSRAFPESAEMFAALLEHSDCGRRRVVGSLALAADDPDPDAGSHRAACVLVVSAPESGSAENEPQGRDRVALLLSESTG